MVIDTARTRHSEEKEEFERRELFWKSNMLNVDSKQSNINKAAVKVMFIMKSTK